MNGRGVPIRCTGPGASRRAFLMAAAITTGGALATGRRSRADRPQTEGHAPLAPTAPHDVAFEGLFITPSAAAAANERINIAFLPQAELDNLRQAFRVLRADNDAIYNTWVNVHVQACQHNNNLIWPWHRAYLYYFEQRLQRANPSANPPVTIPYWNYDRVGNGTGSDTQEFRRLPAPYRPATVGGQANPLFVGRATGVNSGTYVLPYRTVQTDGIVTGSAGYFQFGTNLENSPHNNVHNQLGLPMRDRFFSPSDPVFWLHHSNMDRAWVHWLQVSGHQNPAGPAADAWLNTPLPYFSQLTMFPRKLVREFLDVDALGYTYVEQRIEVAMKAGQARVTTSPPLDFSAALLPPPPPVAVRPVQIRFEGVEPPRSGVLEVRVFLNAPEADAGTSLDDPRFVGMFTLYPPHAGHGAADRTVTIDLSATEAVRGLVAREKGAARFPVTIVVVPSGQAAAENQAETLRLKGVSVRVLD
jgi:hypothetical protein